MFPATKDSFYLTGSVSLPALMVITSTTLQAARNAPSHARNATHPVHVLLALLDMSRIPTETASKISAHQANISLQITIPVYNAHLFAKHAMDLCPPNVQLAKVLMFSMMGYALRNAQPILSKQRESVSLAQQAV